MIGVTFTFHPLCAAPQTDKTALSLPVSPALYAHDTSSSFVICLSPQPHLFPDSQQAVIYMQILVRKRRITAFLLLKNKHSPTILQASLSSIWLDMAFRETQACCLQSWVEGWQEQWAHSGGWWEEGTRLTLGRWQENAAPFIHSILLIRLSQGCFQLIYNHHTTTINSKWNNR